MKLFDVYSLLDMEPVKAQGAYLWDKNGVEYLDFYGGHAVISIGHTHPHYVATISEQLSKIGFYSNAVINGLQVELAEKLGPLTGYPDYELFLCNSGAEANENAVKLASFTTGRARVLAMHGAFHGRTSLAVAISDNPAIQAPVNKTDKVAYIDLNDIEALERELKSEQYAAVIIEPIQGVNGIREASKEFMQAAREVCDKTGTMLICDEVQAGYGRSGRFFSHQWSGIKADIISMAKGIANGFPVGAIMVSPKIPAKKGMLGNLSITEEGIEVKTAGSCVGHVVLLIIIEGRPLHPYRCRIGTESDEHSRRFPAKSEDIRPAHLLQTDRQSLIPCLHIIVDLAIQRKDRCIRIDIFLSIHLHAQGYCH